MTKKRKQIKLFIFLGIAFAFLIGGYFWLPGMLADEVYPLKYEDLIVKYSNKWDVSPALVAAVILQESRFNPNAKSGAGAQGIMQFMPSTAKTMAKETGRYPNYNIFDPETSIEFGAAHLHDMLVKYNGDFDKALAAYNAGGGTVDGWVSRNIFEKIIGSNSKSETVSYVRRVKNYMKVYETMYPKELGLVPTVNIVTPQENSVADVKGLVWMRIFDTIFGGLDLKK